MFDTSPVGNRASNRQKQDIATGNESIWQAVRLHLNLDIVSERSLTDVSNHAEVDDPIFPDTTRPIWKCSFQCFENLDTAIQLNSVTLPIVKSNGFDVFKAR